MVQEENDTLQDDDPATLAALAAAAAGPKKKMTKITNGKNEPAFGLKLTPEHLVFKYISYNPGFASFTISNTKPDRQAFKVKSSDNNMYRAKPSVGFIMPGEQVHIRIIYFNTNQAPPQPNEIKKHVTVYHVSAGNAKTYKEAFAKKVDGVHHYFCNHAADMFGAAADENSQDGEKKDEKK